jgi:O-antigen ligase
MEKAPESRHRAWLTLAAGLAALTVFFVSRVLLERLDLPVRLLVALAPLPFFVLFLVGFIRLVSGMDELERRIRSRLTPSLIRPCSFS